MKRGRISYFNKYPFIKNVLLALAIAVLGFIFLTLTFVFDALFQSLIDGVIKLFTSVDINMVWYWFPPIKHVMFVVVIGIISWFIFRIKLSDFWKATYMIVPLAVVFATIGMFFYQWPVVVYLIGGLFGIGILYYLYKTKQPWLYYYALILIGITMLLVALLGIEI